MSERVTNATNTTSGLSTYTIVIAVIVVLVLAVCIYMIYSKLSERITLYTLESTNENKSKDGKLLSLQNEILMMQHEIKKRDDKIIDLIQNVKDNEKALIKMEHTITNVQTPAPPKVCNDGTCEMKVTKKIEDLFI